MDISNLNLHGAPASGKTSFLGLVMGDPPPDQRCSTGCLEPPARAIVSGTIAAHDSLWEKVSTEKMFDMLCQAIKKKITELALESRLSDSGSKPLANRMQKQPDSPPGSEKPTAQATTNMPPASDNLEQSPSFEQEQPPNEMFTRLLDQLPSVEGSTELFKVKWMLATDSGGQPHFQDVTPLFLRNNSLTIITFRLCERLDHKPAFSFYIKGKPIRMSDSELQLTNLELVESLAKSVSSVQPSHTPAAKSDPKEPKFMVVGTFADKAGECPSESVATKNAILRQHLKDYDRVRIDHGKEVIFPVNTINPNEAERKEAARQLQRKITSAGMSMKAEVPLKWFAFLLNLIFSAEKKGTSVLQLSHCISTGKSLEMEEKEIRDALRFFHDLNLIMHFPTKKLDSVVFVNAKPVLDMLSLLIGISFIDKDELEECFGLHLPAHAQELLQQHGRFSKKMLEIHFQFSSPLTAGIFLDLLEHIMVVAPIQLPGETEFFLPCALPYASEDEISERQQKTLHPWIVRLKSMRGPEEVHVPIPKGFFPTLVVHLLATPSFKADHRTRQYRNAMSLCFVPGGKIYLIESRLQLEVYYSWDERLPEQCSTIRSSILEGISTAEAKLHFAPGVLIKEDAFLCSCGRHNSHHLCAFNHLSRVAECEKSEMPCDLKPENVRWLSQPTPGMCDKG